MRPQFIALLFSGLLFSGLLFCGGLFCTPGAQAALFGHKNDNGYAKETIVVGGDTRSYLVAPVNDGQHHPIVILLHGGTNTAESVWQQTSLPAIAAREHFVLVAPQGEGNHWNDGRGQTLAPDGPSTADDLSFIHAVIAQVAQQFGGDAQAVFITGASNGGFMSLYYACQRAEDLRAGASVIADLPVSVAQDCNPKKQVPWMAVNGTNDPLIPFKGQPAGTKRHGKEQIALMSADDTFTFMADKAGCGKQVDTRDLPNNGGDDWAEERRRTGCANGAQSLQYVLHGDGHSWPGMHNGLVVKMLGGSSNDVDAGEIIWDFFKSTLPAQAGQ